MFKALILLCILSLWCACAKQFTLSSAFAPGAFVPAKYSYAGKNVNPPLSWDPSTLPKGTKSLALIIDDPDAPNGTWSHWLVKDIPATLNHIAENSVPGKQIVNSWGTKAYGGMSLPSGTHRYFFQLYAMPTKTLSATTMEDFYDQVKAQALGGLCYSEDFQHLTSLKYEYEYDAYIK